MLNPNATGLSRDLGPVIAATTDAAAGVAYFLAMTIGGTAPQWPVVLRLDFAAAAANVSFSLPKRQCGQVVVYCGARADSNAAGAGPLLEAKTEHIFAFCQSIAIIARAADRGLRVPRGSARTPRA